MFYPFYFDPTYILVIIGLAISGLASSYVQSTFNRYSDVHTKLGYNASEITRYILDYANLENVKIERVRGNLTDHYDSNNKVLRLSDATNDSTSVAAIGVAAHEAGHALQDRDNYVYLRLRSALVPITNIGQTAAFPILLIGAIVGDHSFIGSNSNLVAPVNLGDNSFVAAGSTITEEIPENALGIARARQVNKKDFYTEYFKEENK